MIKSKLTSKDVVADGTSGDVEVIADGSGIDISHEILGILCQIYDLPGGEPVVTTAIGEFQRLKIRPPVNFDDILVD